MLASVEAERRAAGSRALVLGGGVCALIGLVVLTYAEHAPLASNHRAPALALFVPPAVGLRPVAAPPGPQTMPAASPLDMAGLNTPGAGIPAAPALMPMESPGPAAPATPMYVMPAPVHSPGTQTGPQMFSGFFAGLASSFAVGFILVAKQIYDGTKKNGDGVAEVQDMLELGIMTASASPKSAVADVARTQVVYMQFGKKPAKKGAKKVAKRPVKKVVKKAAKKVAKKKVAKKEGGGGGLFGAFGGGGKDDGKKGAKKAAKKPIKKVAKKGKSQTQERSIFEELGFGGGNVVEFGAGAVEGYGGGGGSVLLSPTFLIAAALWLAVLFRYVLFYGFFETGDGL